MSKLLYMFIILLMGCSTSSIQNYNIKNTKDVSLRDKIAQMIMIRVDGKFKNNNHQSYCYLSSIFNNQ